MEQRDLLKDQLEQMLRALSRILSQLLNTANGSSAAQAMEAVTNQLQSELDIDVEALLQLSAAQLKHYLTERNFSEQQLETLSAILREMGHHVQKSDPQKASLFLAKAIDLLDIADQTSNAVSLVRISTKSQLQAELATFVDQKQL